jgi:Methyltransferase domain
VDVVVRRGIQLSRGVAEGRVIIARRIEPEWLDALPSDDPRAMRSRRDLRRINALMMNRALVVRELRRVRPRGAQRAIAEIGAGDGTFMLRVAEQLLPDRQAADVVLLDRQSLVLQATNEKFISIGWRPRPVSSDVFAWLDQSSEPAFDVIVANLFLHHFDADRLAELLRLIARRTRVLIACEPRRSGPALLGSYLLGLIGCNDVSRHDAVVSVRAGFNGKELSALWPARSGWLLRERAHGLFSHSFVATCVDCQDIS